MSDRDPQRLQRVLRKYRLLLALRVERDEAVRLGHTHFAEPQAVLRRTRLKALAEEFPGSLRELESSTASRLGLRVEILDAALRQRAVEPVWVQSVDAFHLVLRQALVIKRWLVDRAPRGRAVDERLVRDFNHDHPEQARRLTSADLRAYLRPPDGRLLNLVWADLDERLGRSRADLERDIYG